MNPETQAGIWSGKEAGHGCEWAVTPGGDLGEGPDCGCQG